MNLRDEAKRRLAEYRYRKHAVERLPEEIRRLEVIAERMGASDLDGDPVQGGESNQEDALLKNYRRQGKCWPGGSGTMWTGWSAWRMH